MSNFTDFIAKTTSEKIILFELDYGQLNTTWYPHNAGIWAWKYYTRQLSQYHALGEGNLGFGNLGGTETADTGETESFTSVGSMKVDGSNYTEASTLANCMSLDSSWYYDYDEQILYFHGANYTEPQSHTIVVGITKGMSNRALDINSQYYEPRIVSDVEISKTLDSLEWGIISFDGATLTLSNEDGFFDNLFDKYIFGQQAILKFGGNADRNDPMAYADYRTMFKGQVGNVKLGENEVEMQLIENRGKLSRMIPPNTFSQTAYPNLADKNVGKPIPIVYGTCYRIPVTCINEEDASPFTFLCADTANHSDGLRAISHAYVEGVSVPISTTSLPSATFQLTGTHYTAGQKVSADVIGLYTSGAASADTSTDILKDILQVFGSITYNSDNYNTTVYGSVSSYNIGLFIDEKTEMYNSITLIPYSNMANFIPEDDGRYSWHKFDSGEAAAFTVGSGEILEGERIAPQYDHEDYLTSCHVGYAKQWDENEYRWASDTSHETSSHAKYGKYRELRMETLLTNATDAANLASAVMSYMAEVRMRLTNATGIQYMDRDVGDTCNLNGDRVNKAWMGSVKCEIVGIYKTLGNSPKVTIVGRAIP